MLAPYKVGARGGEAEKKAMMDYYVADAEWSLKRLQNHQARQQREGGAGERPARQCRGCRLIGDGKAEHPIPTCRNEANRDAAQAVAAPA